MTVTEQPPARHRRGRLVLAVAVAVVAAATAAAILWRPDPAAVDVRGGGRRAPTFSVPDLRDGNRTIELAGFRGTPVVLNFWASWCVPCRREMPTFEAVHQAMGDRVAFVGINHQDGRGDALDLLGDTGVTYPSGYDPQGDIARAYRLFGMPTTVFITVDGRIAGQHTGELSRADLEAAIADLVNE